MTQMLLNRAISLPLLLAGCAAAVGLQGAAVTAPVALGTDRAFDRIRKLEAAERERGAKEADAAFKDAVAK